MLYSKKNVAAIFVQPFGGRHGAPHSAAKLGCSSATAAVPAAGGALTSAQSLPSPPQPPPPGRPRVVTSAGSEKRARPAWLRAAPHRLGRRPRRDARPRTKSPPDRLQRESGRWGRGPGPYQTPAVGTSGTGGGCRRSEETRG